MWDKKIVAVKQSLLLARATRALDAAAVSGMLLPLPRIEPDYTIGQRKLKLTVHAIRSDPWGAQAQGVQHSLCLHMMTFMNRSTHMIIWLYGIIALCILVEHLHEKVRINVWPPRWPCLEIGQYSGCRPVPCMPNMLIGLSTRRLLTTKAVGKPSSMSWSKCRLDLLGQREGTRKDGAARWRMVTIT